MLGRSAIDSCRTLHVHINLSAAFLECIPTAICKASAATALGFSSPWKAASHVTLILLKATPQNGKLGFVEPTWRSDSDFLEGLLRRFRPSELFRFLPRLEEELRRLFFFRSCKKKDLHADSNPIKCDSAQTLFGKASK